MRFIARGSGTRGKRTLGGRARRLTWKIRLWPSFLASTISSRLQLALLEIYQNQALSIGFDLLPILWYATASGLTPCTIPHSPAPLVKFTSPSGWPSLAMAAGAIYTGKVTWCPSMVDEGSFSLASRSLESVSVSKAKVMRTV
jgi:hypothetical protein